MKFSNPLIIISLLLVGCSEKPQKPAFSYEKAIVLFQNEIKKMEDGPEKNILLWHSERILERDTLYKQKLASSAYDSMMFDLRYDFFKDAKRQLYLDRLESLTVDDGIEAYRFHYTRAFSSDIVIITVSKQQGGQNTIAWQVVRMDPNYNPLINKMAPDGSDFRVKLNESRHISNEEWLAFIQIINETHYWDLPSEDDTPGLDGSDWTVEGSRSVKDNSGKSHQIFKSVHRWAPDRGTSIYMIGKYLLNTHDFHWGEIY